MPTFRFALALILAALFYAPHALARQDAFHIDGAQQKWHPITITFEGPETDEAATPNPFRDYRLDVIFRHDASGRAYTVPGYFAADGEAAETGATAGAAWRARFTPDATGRWSFTASFRTGPDVALDPDPDAGTAAAFDGTTGTFVVQETDKEGRDMRGRGRLEYVGARYLRFQNGDYFLKGGADSPENLLAYHEFDGTYSIKEAGAQRTGEANTAPLHRFEPHIRDWQPGDPTWHREKGKGLIGALNYLAAEGMNAVYFLTMNVAGDGQDVWPWTAPDVMDRFDISKLDQWNRVFDHMDRLGLMQHVVLTETENESLFELRDADTASFADTRKLYYRELVARFAHHPALVWNLGEENGWAEQDTTDHPGHPNTDAQRKAFAAYLRALDPYDHPIVVHTLPGRYDEIYTPLLGYEHFEGPSLQMGDMTRTHAETQAWIRRSEEQGRPWFVSLDEVGPADTGVTPDGPGNNHDDVRRHALWGNLMAGGAGVEWYFGYRYPHNDLNAEDWRSRNRMWDYTRHALDFFHQHLPFWEMAADDDRTDRADDYVFAGPEGIYAVYLPTIRPTRLRLDGDGWYAVRWYNPRTGGALQTGSVTRIHPNGSTLLGRPPAEWDQDWVVLIVANGEG